MRNECTHRTSIRATNYFTLGPSWGKVGQVCGPNSIIGARCERITGTSCSNPERYLARKQTPYPSMARVFYRSITRCGLRILGEELPKQRFFRHREKLNTRKYDCKNSDSDSCSFEPIFQIPIFGFQLEHSSVFKMHRRRPVRLPFFPSFTPVIGGNPKSNVFTMPFTIVGFYGSEILFGPIALLFNHLMKVKFIQKTAGYSGDVSSPLPANCAGIWHRLFDWYQRPHRRMMGSIDSVYRKNHM